MAICLPCRGGVAAADGGVLPRRGDSRIARFRALSPYFVGRGLAPAVFFTVGATIGRPLPHHHLFSIGDSSHSVPPAALSHFLQHYRRNPPSLRDGSFFYGLSPGLKKCPPDTFLPSRRLGRPLRVPPGGRNKRGDTPWVSPLLFGTPEGTRTPNPRNRNPMLYPLSHRCICLTARSL